jgi:ABC-2 type transport system permease protein
MQVLTGTRRLIRLALRRDRFLLPAWIVSISGLTAAVVSGITSLYATDADRLAGAQFSAASPMTRVFDGPASGTAIGAMAMVEAFKVLAILTALMSAQAVVRHTRQEEETGRAELIGSTVVGHNARLAAALTVAVGANIALGAAVTTLLLLNGLALAGSLAAALAVAGVGVVFAGIAAVGAQVFATARAANAAAGAALGVAFLLRAVGDIRGRVADNGVELVSTWPSWLSPFGWGQQVRPFYQDNWWIAWLFVSLATLLMGAAFVLTDHRDVGAGMVSDRSGPARAAPGLRSPLGLAGRLQRTILLAWIVGLAVTGAAFGWVGKSVRELVSTNEQFRQMLTQMAPRGSVIDLYFAFMIAFIGIAAAAYTVQALLRMRTEEVAGRLEPVLATAVGRRRWLLSHVAVTTAGTVLALSAAGLAGGVVYGAMTGDWSTGIGGLLVGGLVQVPAALALGGFVVAAFGLVPRWAGTLAWVALAGSLVMGQLGALLKLPQWALDISPFTHVPRMPAEAFSATPVGWLLAAAVALAAVGFVAFRRRDLTTTG